MTLTSAEIVEQLKSGFLSVYLKPNRKEWFGWVLSFIVVSLGIYYKQRKEAHQVASLRGGLAYIFPKQTYLGLDTYKDILCIGVNIFFLGIFSQILFGFPFYPDSFSEFLIKISSNTLVQIPPTSGKTSPLINWIYSFHLFMAYEFGWFSSHWMLHRFPVLWAFHKVHHSAITLNPLFAFKRLHFLEIMLTSTIIGTLWASVSLLFAASGYTPTVVRIANSLPLFSAAYLFFGLMRHSHVPLSFGKLNWVFLSPSMHQVHHSAKPEHLNKNFGFFLSAFDWVFSTIYIPKKAERLHFGLSETAPVEEGFIKMYFIQPILDCRTWISSRQISQNKKSSDMVLNDTKPT